MLSLIVCLLCHREVSSDNTAIAFSAHPSFGLLQNGTATFTFALEKPVVQSSFRFIVHLFSYAEYLDFDLDPNIYDENCDSARLTSSWNFTFPLSPVTSPFTRVETAGTKTVIVPVVFHCNHSNADDANYKLTIVYDNIVTLLDYRELPNLTMIPVVIGVWSAAFLAWLVFSFIRIHGFVRVHGFLTLLAFLFLVTLALTFLWYRHADHSDSDDGWLYANISVEGFFWANVFFFLAVASSGWGAIVTRLTRAKVARSAVTAVVLIGSIYVMRYAPLGLWGLFLLLSLGMACYFFFREVYENTQYAQTEIKAHLLVISNSGIDPTTTPVYAKYMRYVSFLALAVAVALGIGILTLVLAFVDAAHWIELLVFYVFTMVFLGMVAWLYRPRGEKLDRYMLPDEEDNADRQAIQLEDLSGFDVGKVAGGEAAAWDGESPLPPQPKLIRPNDADGNLLPADAQPPMYLTTLVDHGEYQ
jgi:cbb3-type cytochrome oxidase subunit 3